MKKSNIPQDDDGRTVADMSALDEMRGKPGRRHTEELPPELRPTKRESLAIMLNAMLAGLVVAVILGVAGALFILFCEYVWLR